jgi:Nif-specific regulatory protein
LLESELFGHVRGAFTGAVDDREGRFELADGGTIFLDEVGSMSEKLQVKLLRVLQEREFERVGGTETIGVDVRIVAATNKNLEELVSDGRFREDLYYRLNVIPILIPPLRDRRDDVPFLVEHFLDKYGGQYDKEVTKMSRELVDALTQYHWPGNVRELESCIERAVVLSQDGTIGMELLPVSVRSAVEGPEVPEPLGAPDEVAARLVRDIRRETAGRSTNLHERVVCRVEKALIEETLAANDGVQTRTARELGISRNTLRRKIEDYQIAGPA